MKTALIKQTELTISSLKDLLARTSSAIRVQASALSYLEVVKVNQTENPMSDSEAQVEQAGIAELATIFDNLSDAVDTAMVGIMVVLSKLEKIDDKN